jgi:excisionase family DNA binding protein
MGAVMSAAIKQSAGVGNRGGVDATELPQESAPGAGQDASATGNEPVFVATGPPRLPADEVIDVEAVARLLRIGRNTVYTLVSRNEIPHRRLGKQIRFHRVAVMQWLATWSSQGAKERQ